MVSFGIKSSKSKHQATQLTPDELIGFVYALTPDQKELLSELKKRFVNERAGNEDLFDDLFLVRFLRARQFDLNKTTTMLTKYFAWRAQVDLPKVLKMNLTSIRDTIKMYYPHCFYGTDKLGRPINIEHMGLSDTTKLVHVLPQEELTNYFIQRYEYLTHVVLPSCSMFANHNVEQILTIVDLKGLQVHQINSKFRSFLSSMSGLTQNYYPENLGKLLFINASPVFSAIYTLLSALVDKKTLSKISVISSKTESLERVAELVEKDQLPKFLGGTRPDENWYSSSFGPWTDESILQKLKERPHVQEDLYNYEFL
ncbi:phosphatidylinositol/phosphatidylcholine transfer protein [Theileria orientalis]|uniref:Phosphatidylinositol/phosphatidylcholine transfer protein n=1 Tax=Theileria orientalis TaxID=68886 RepID=A0A976M8Y1_THEOR|nr:phosphatidylinositol/phosphatidylcholine transfer protein [Theileria orientalis]